MPNVVQGNVKYRNVPQAVLDQNYDYDYPEGLNLKPGSKLHDRLKNKVLENARESAGHMSKRFDSWNEIDNTLTTYIYADDAEQAVKTADSRKPVSIVFPYSYAILESLMAYMVSAFFQDPVFRYEGVGSEDTVGAIMLERLVAHQVYRMKMELNLHTLFRDSLAYGLGPIAPLWHKEMGVRITPEPEGYRNFFGKFVQTGFGKSEEDVVLYEGNKLENIDVYKYLPDPNVSVHAVQDGEYSGWIQSTNIMSALSDDKAGELFNVRYLKHITGLKSSIYAEDNSGRNDKVGTKSTQNNENVSNPLDIIWMYVNLIPKDEGLGSSEYPEKWLFALGADEVIVQAKPLGLIHNMYPVAVAAPDFDGYSANPISRMEIIYGLQGTLDWLFNSHVANVRKAINDMLVVDPYMLNMRDLKDPQPGKLIRMRRPAWGKGVDGAVKQLVVNDITRGNVADSAFIVDWMQKVSGADDVAMGSLRKGGPERLTGAEFQGTAQGMVNRLERIARVIGLQSMQDLGYMMAAHTQQLMTEPTKIRITGRGAEELMAEFGNNQAMVDPYQILVDYDVRVRDGSVPGGNYSEVWLKMWDSLTTNPELAQKFDVVRIFKHIARNAGAKNVNEFVRINTMGDQQVQDQVQQGNLIPFAQGGSNA